MENCYTIEDIRLAIALITSDRDVPDDDALVVRENAMLVSWRGRTVLIASDDLPERTAYDPFVNLTACRFGPECTCELSRARLHLPSRAGTVADVPGLAAYDLTDTQTRKLFGMPLPEGDDEPPDERVILMPWLDAEPGGLERALVVPPTWSHSTGLPVLQDVAGKTSVVGLAGIVTGAGTVAGLAALRELVRAGVRAGRK